MFKAAKDALTSQGAKTWANKLIARYGSVQELKIDSRRKTIEVECVLAGEVSPITIKVENYVIETDDSGKRFIRATALTCSRPWLQNILTDFCTQRFELPAWAAAAL